MKAVIMAGGSGTRLRPLTVNKAKPMIPVMNKPLMEHILLSLKNAGITQVASTLWYRPEDVTSYFGDGSSFSVQMEYAIEDTPLGTAGSVRNALSFLEEPVLVVSGDSLTDIPLKEAIAFHKEKKALATIVLTEVVTPLEYGVVIKDEEGRITRFLEKPDWSQVFSNTVNTGIYILEPEVLQQIPKDRAFDFSKDLFPKLLAKKAPLYAMVAKGYWSDIGTLSSYQTSQNQALERNVDLKLNLKEKDTCILEEGVQLVPPFFLGANCYVEKGAIVGPYTVIGDNSFIGARSTIRHSTLWKNSMIGTDVEISGAVLAEGCILAKGVRVSEGVVVGDKVEVGSLARISPLVKIWPNKRIQSGTTVQDTLVWGHLEGGPLFSKERIEGELKGSLTPETLIKIGLSLAALHKNKGTYLLTSDETKQGIFAKETLENGLRAGGMHVLDCGCSLSHITSFGALLYRVQGAVHVCGEGANGIILQVFDEKGRPLKKKTEREVEQFLAREDYARSIGEGLGGKTREPYLLSRYLETLLTLFEGRSLPLRVSIAEQPGFSLYNQVARDFLSGLVANDAQEERKLQVELLGDGWVVEGMSGQVFSSDKALTYVLPRLKALGCQKVAVPVDAKQATWETARVLGFEVEVAPRNQSTQMEMADELGNTWSSGLDISLCSLMDPFLSLGEAVLLASQDYDGVDRETAIWESTVFCPWEKKGRVMRELLYGASSSASLVDGLKEETEAGTVMVFPDGDAPVFVVRSESDSYLSAKSLGCQYVALVEQLVGGEEAP